jgi:hypothetical protein
MPTIYEIADDLRALHDLLAETGGEVTPETEAALAAFEAEMLANTSEKLDRYCSLIAELDARSASRKAEAKRIGDLARTDERVADSLRERLRWFFETNGIGKQETARFRVSLVANGGKAPLILDCAVDELPAWAISNRPSVNSEAIREALERGDIVPFAHLGERGKRVSIR